MAVVKRILFIAPMLIAFLGTMVLLSACGSNDFPPDDPASEPAPIYGEYVTECGVFTLNADHALHIDITEEFSKKSGLPAGENSGTYVFLYRNEEWRYDKAETFQITIKGINYSFLNAVGTTNNKTLAFYLPDGDIVLFNKSEE
ncbi:MAG: hypothetical protein IK063_06120 [Clostridia bacterium]|nr:hypothetical protein [Clostridia bacterium]